MATPGSTPSPRAPSTAITPAITRGARPASVKPAHSPISRERAGPERQAPVAVAEQGHERDQQGGRPQPRADPGRQGVDHADDRRAEQAHGQGGGDRTGTVPALSGEGDRDAGQQGRRACAGKPRRPARRPRRRSATRSPGRRPRRPAPPSAAANGRRGW